MENPEPASPPEPQPEQNYEEYSQRMERLGQFRVDNLRNDLAGIFRGFGNFYPGKFFPHPWRSIINIIIALAAAVYAVIDLGDTLYESTEENPIVLAAFTAVNILILCSNNPEKYLGVKGLSYASIK